MSSNSTFRPPAIPLIAHDPYFSIWAIHEDSMAFMSRHWTGFDHLMYGYLRLDNDKSYRFFGSARFEELKMTQKSVEVLPTRTIYIFEIENVVSMKMSFITPALPHKLEVLSRPATYVQFEVKSLDGKEHDVQIYYEIGRGLAVNANNETVNFGRQEAEKFDMLYVASTKQDILKNVGDNLRIEWGRGCMVIPKTYEKEICVGFLNDARSQFIASGTLPYDELDLPQRNNDDGGIAMSVVFPMSLNADGKEVKRMAIVAYDDIKSLAYLERPLYAYFRKDGMTFSQMIAKAVAEYDELAAECEAYDAEMMSLMTEIGGAKYAKLCALSFRQAISAHKLVYAYDKEKSPWFFSKENFSNGCIATVDVTYPSAPLFLLTAPALIRGMMLPILDYARSGRWKFEYAPHDLGTYPLANGQVYGGGERSDDNQMPVEECGNMLLLAGALLKFDNDKKLIDDYWDLWSKWAKYLTRYGFDPENQLCTDDFAGHLAHNCNLSIKAILALGAFSQMAEVRGEKELAAEYRALAEDCVKSYIAAAMPEDKSKSGKLAFDQEGTWSQKYNLVWDKLLDLNIFPEEIAQREIKCYLEKMTPYGVPLDSRKTYTKLDWQVWSACLAEDDTIFGKFIDAIYNWCEKTPDRVPLSDWYETDEPGHHHQFRARSVVGGVFIKGLYSEKVIDIYHRKLK
ncbi:MAG: DUF4965 domain-containing protein [Lentisphaeria bacterium]|nr:DUF4965 domain-containing protein [Lentisphaeria bacterium]